MSSNFSKEEQAVLELLKNALHNETIAADYGQDINWFEVLNISKNHSVSAIIYEVIKDNINIASIVKNDYSEVADQTVLQSYKLAFMTKALIDKLAGAGITAVALKGACAAEYYPVPELRKSGDIDILVEDGKEELAKEVLINNGFEISDEQHANHHTVFYNQEHIELELHTMLTEPFDNEAINRYLEKIRLDVTKHICRVNVMGLEIPTLHKAYFAYQLLLHMLQHFLRAGFGLKLLCDWVVFWESEMTERDRHDYLRLVEESKIKGFSDMITAVCIYMLGLDGSKTAFMFSDKNRKLPEIWQAEAFLKEVLNSEEFGHSSEDRMVVLRGTGLTAYAREFHHQMKLNFPKAGKVFICWPYTWLVTLLRFLVNNKKVRKTSVRQVFKTAKQRSYMMKEIKLFKE